MLCSCLIPWDVYLSLPALHQKRSFPLRISSVNVIKSAGIFSGNFTFCAVLSKCFWSCILKFRYLFFRFVSSPCFKATVYSLLRLLTNLVWFYSPKAQLESSQTSKMELSNFRKKANKNYEVHLKVRFIENLQ